MNIKTPADAIAWLKTVRHFNCGSVIGIIEAALAREAALREDLVQCGSMAAMIEGKEWAEHAGSGPVSSRVESAFTQLHNELSETQQRLTVAEKLLREVSDSPAWGLGDIRDKIDAALKTVTRQQEEPVAWTVRGPGGKIDKGYSTCFKSEAEGWMGTLIEGYAVLPLYAEQPAPVAVVMPERKPQRITDEYARGWNDYDAEYKRLNGVKP